ncbi:MAG TPA: PAS domain S-box protein [Polyangiales bacterium]
MADDVRALADLFAAAEECILLLSASGDIVYANAAAERLFGVRGLCAQSYPALFPAARRPALNAMIALLGASDPVEDSHRELTLQLDAIAKRLSMRMSAARWAGAPLVMVVARDAELVTPAPMSAAQQSALTRSDQLFRALFDSSAFAITITDPKTGRLLEVNRAFERNGVSREQAIGRTTEELGMILPGVQDRFLEQLMTEGSTRIVVLPYVNATGQSGNTLFCASTVTIEGEPLVFSIAFDVTEFQRAQDELRESDSKFRALFDNIVDAMFFVDSAGRFIEVNAAACTQLGYTRDELLDRSALAVLGGNEFDFAEVAQRLRTSGQLSFESMQERKDGSQFPIGMTLAAIEYRGSYAIAGIGRDLSERKQREDELTRINDELMRFAYTVSHDLKSPLVTIKSFLGYLKEDLADQDGERVERDLSHIERAAERMGSLLDDLLELSRVGRKVNPPERVELAQLVREAGEVVAGRLAVAGAELVVDAPGVWLWGDHSRLREVFQNLIDNAVKFARPGVPPRIRVDVDKQGGELVIAVRDNGIGIDPRHRHKLFGLFEKLHAHVEGTGIGLALVKRIVEVHGGRVWVDSEGEGYGTTVCLVLPGTTEEA